MDNEFSARELVCAYVLVLIPFVMITIILPDELVENLFGER